MDQQGLVVDALPYIDQGYDESARQAAMALIEEECKRYHPTKNYLSHLPEPKFDLFTTDIMKSEFERIQQRQPMEMLSMKRYELPGPSAGRMTDLNSWQEAVNNAQAQLEHQETRLANLELMSEYGSESWKSFNETQQKVLNLAQKELAALRSQIQEIHLERKRKQTAAGDKLKNLETSWVTLVTKNYQIEKACVEIENEIAPLRKKFKSD